MLNTLATYFFLFIRALLICHSRVVTKIQTLHLRLHNHIHNPRPPCIRIAPREPLPRWDCNTLATVSAYAHCTIKVESDHNGNLIILSKRTCNINLTMNARSSAPRAFGKSSSAIVFTVFWTALI